jgi:hypothetical protein
VPPSEAAAAASATSTPAPPARGESTSISPVMVDATRSFADGTGAAPQPGASGVDSAQSGTVISWSREDQPPPYASRKSV